MLGSKVYEYFSVMVSLNDHKCCNVIEHRKQFFKDFNIIFPYRAKRASYVIFMDALKRLIFSSSTIMCYVNKTDNIKLQKYPTLTHEHSVKSHHCLSNEWLHKHTVKMMYYCFHYKFESNPLNKVFWPAQS